MIYSGGMETPIRTLSAMANGVISEGMENAIVEMMNGKISALPKLAVNGIKSGINAVKRNKE